MSTKKPNSAIRPRFIAAQVVALIFFALVAILASPFPHRYEVSLAAVAVSILSSVYYAIRLLEAIVRKQEAEVVPRKSQDWMSTIHDSSE